MFTQIKSSFSNDFWLVAIGQIISIFGNQIIRFALPLYLLNKTGSSALFGSIMAISFVPMIILFPIGGMIADRLNKKNIMVLLDFSTAILLLLFSVLSGFVDIVPLMAITMILLFGIQGAYQPAVKASVPVLVDKDHIMKANSIVDMISSVASLAGPVVGGLLFSAVGLGPILFVSIVCFIASAIMETFIHMPFEQKPAPGNIVQTGLADMKESFRFMRQDQPVLWQIALVFACSNLLLTSLILIALPVLITQQMGFDPDTANTLYGYAQGVLASGAILGGLLAGALSNRLKSKAGPYFLIGCSLSVGFCGLALKTFVSPMAIYGALLAASALLLVLHTLFQIQVMTYLQVLTPKRMIGKVISCFMCVVLCTSPLGQFIYGHLFERFVNNVGYLFYIAALIMIILCICTRGIFNGLDGLAKGEPPCEDQTVGYAQ